VTTRLLVQPKNEGWRRTWRGYAKLQTRLPGKSPRLNFTEATVHDSAQRKRATVCARGNFFTCLEAGLSCRFNFFETETFCMAKLTVRDLDVRGKRVFLRVDYNVPLEEKDGQMVITDATRIVATLPTLKLLIEKGGKADSDRASGPAQRQA